MAGLLDVGPRALEALRAAADPGRIADEGRPLDEIELLAPVPRPGKVVAIGRNYREHVDEEGADRPPAPLIFSKWPSSVIGDGAEIRWDPEPDCPGRLRGRARRRDRPDGAPRQRGRRARPRARLHLPQRRLGARPPVRRRPMGARQVARHVLPDGPGARHGRRDPGSAGLDIRVAWTARCVQDGEHQPDVLRGRRDHQLLLAVVQPGAGRRHRDRDARRRRHLPRPAAPARRRRRGDRRDRGGRSPAERLPHRAAAVASA